MQTANRLNSTKEYYFSKKLREVREAMAAGRPIINLGIGSPDLPPPNGVVEALTNALSHPKAHQYQPYQGVLPLREAMVNFYKNHYQVNLDPNTQVLPLMGSKEGIMHIAMAFLNPGDAVLIPNPGYPTYAAVANLVEAETISYNLSEQTNWFPDLEALAQKDLSRVKLFFVNYPHMPTGAPATLAFFNKLVVFAKTHDILVVNDNPYSFILNQNPLSILEAHGAQEVCLELNSLSKTFNMSGWRVGMLAGSPAHIQSVLKVKSNMDSGMFYGLQQGAIVALNSDTDWYQQLNGTYRTRRDWVWKIADALQGTYSKEAQGLFVWIKLPDHINAASLSDALLEKANLFITPGSVFGSQGAGYLRISLCVSQDELKTAFNRVEEFVKQHD